MSEQRNDTIQGEPIDLDTLLDFATVDIEDIESAILWWDEIASIKWQGALDSEPIEG